MLQIRIDNDDTIPLGHGQADANGGFLPEIPGKMHCLDERIIFLVFGQHAIGIVLRSVIDDNDFKRGCNLFYGRFDFLDGVSDDTVFVCSTEPRQTFP